MHNFKDDTSSLSEDNSIAKITTPDGATIAETLVELKALIGSLQQKVKIQEDKVEDLDNHLVRICSTEITGIENTLEKVENAVNAHSEQFF